RSLDQLLRQPSVLVAEARQIAEVGPRPDPTRTPILTWRAERVVDAFAGDESFAVPAERRDDLARSIAAVRGQRGQTLDRGAIVPLLTLEEQLRESHSLADERLRTLLLFIEGRHQFQCARYDGPLRGTQVGMTLFYTDLLAKLWASVDYGHSAPIDRI